MQENVRCIHCGSSNARRLIQKGWATYIMRMFSRVPYHCQGCYKIFYAPRPEQVNAA